MKENVVLGLLGTLVVIILGLLILFGIDGCRATEDARFPATIQTKVFVPAYTEMHTTYVSDGRGGGSFIVIPIYHPQEYRFMAVDAEGRSHNIYYNATGWGSYKEGDTIYVAHFKGPWGWNQREEFRSETK